MSQGQPNEGLRIDINTSRSENILLPNHQFNELRIHIEPTPIHSNLDTQDPAKNETNQDLNTPQERFTQVIQDNQPSNIIPTLSLSTQYVNLPADPPPYSELPIYTIPLPDREGRIMYDPPPPYDPTMRRETFDPLDFPYEDYRPTRRSRFECKPDTLVPLGFCYCTLEQLIVTLAILGTFVFLGLGQIN